MHSEKAPIIPSFHDNDFTVQQSPPQLPDDNPVTHLVDVVKQEICSIKVQTTNLQQLHDAIMSVWTKISEYRYLSETLLNLCHKGLKHIIYMHIYVCVYVCVSISPQNFHKRLGFRYLTADYANITAWTTPVELSDADTHTHTHTTPITSLPWQRAVGAGQRRLSIDWAQKRRRKGRKEPQAMSSRGGEDLLEISAPWVFLPHMAKTCGQTAAIALFCQASIHTEREGIHTVGSPIPFTSHWFNQ